MNNKEKIHTNEIETETIYIHSVTTDEKGKKSVKPIPCEIYKKPKYDEPKLLVVKELISDLMANSCEIDKYANNLNYDNYKCNFIYAYTLFEGALWQLAKSIFFAFPERLKTGDDKSEPKSLKIPLNDIDIGFDGGAIIEALIDEKLKMISTGKLANYFDDIMKIAEIRVNYDKNDLNEISKERNAIVHTNTAKINNEFNRAALPKHANENAIINHLRILKGLLDEVQKAITTKYKVYTYKYLLESAWNYTVGGYYNFNTLIGFFQYKKGDKTTVYPNFDMVEKALKGFSSTEKAMLAIWLQQYGSDNLYELFKENKPFKAWTWLDKGKLIFLATLFDKFPHLMDGYDYTSEIEKKE